MTIDAMREKKGFESDRRDPVLLRVVEEDLSEKVAFNQNPES